MRVKTVIGGSFAPGGFRLRIENMRHTSTEHEVLAVVFQVRQVTGATRREKPQLNVLLWQRARDPQEGAWSLPGGRLRTDEDMTTSVRRQLAEKVDLRELAHLEQLAVFSDPHRVPGARVIASTFLGLVPSPATPELPPDTRWHPVNSLPPMAFDHGPMVAHAQTRLVAKMSYTNIGFALAPREFALSTLRDIYGAALGYQVDATNLQRVLVRRGVISQTGIMAQSGRSGGRPAALYHFTDSRLRVTDEFAAFRPPGV
jgi:ADP-ribose pyrophosphatase YjhB (NUDIX family)